MQPKMLQDSGFKWVAPSLNFHQLLGRDHIRELESLMLRIADPKGNVKGGRITHASNLHGELDAKIREEQDRKRKQIFGSKRKTRKPRTRRKPATKTKKGRTPTLAPYMAKVAKKWIGLRGTHKGKTYKARVLGDGSVKCAGKVHNSPSLAGKTAIGRAVNGWTFWRYRKARGEWVKLDELRRN